MNPAVRPKEKNFISAVIYLFNDEEWVGGFLEKLDVYLRKRFESFEYVIVNDASTDRSVAEIKKITPQLVGTVNVVNMAWKHGVELAVLAGMDAAIGDFIFEIESVVNDWEVELFNALYEASQSGYDIVAATPRGGERLTSTIFYWIFKKVSNLKMNLSTETVRLVSRRALNALLMSKEKVRYRKLLYKLTGFRYVNIKYEPTSRHLRQRQPFKNNFFLAFNIFTNYSDIGLQFALFLAMLFFGISVFGGLYAVFMYLYLDRIMEGWTTTMLFLSAGFSGIFFLLAVESKYISNILTEVKDKPAYRVAEVKRLPKQ